nr:MAG TPA_asm: hypothetical protein [Caudoviricetes sp.]
MVSTTTGALRTVNPSNTTDIITLRAQETRPKGADLTLDLSQGNSLYGSSDTVQPKGMYVQALIRYS